MINSIRWWLVKALGGDKPMHLQIDRVWIIGFEGRHAIEVSGNHIKIEDAVIIDIDRYKEMIRGD